MSAHSGSVHEKRTRHSRAFRRPPCIQRCLFAVCTIVLGTASVSPAQSPVKISGRISDRASGSPLPGSHVLVLGTGYGAAASESGEYVLSDVPDGAYRLRVTMVGYAPHTTDWVQIRADRIARVDVALRPQPFMAPEVVVTAPRPQESARDGAADRTAVMETVTAAVIRRSGARTVGELLAAVAGVYVRDTGGAGGSKTLSVRGSSGDQVVVFLDGVRLGTALHGPVDLSTIPVSLVERVEIVKGGNAALYGPNAMGGVIHITTRQSLLPVGERSGFRLDGGAFGTTVLQGFASHGLGPVALFASYERLTSRGDFPYTDEFGQRVRRENADLVTHTGFLKAQVASPATTAQALTQFSRTHRGLPGFLFNPTADARSQDWQCLTQGIVTHQFASDASVEWRASLLVARDRDAKPSVFAYDADNRTGALDTELRFLYRPHSNVRLNGGSAFRRDAVNGADRLFPLYSVGRRTRRLQAVFLHADVESGFPVVADRMVLVGAARLDHTGQLPSQFSPKVGLLLSRGAATRMTVRTNLARSYRLPDFYDLYFEGYRARGNPDLRPERGIDFDAGAQVDLAAAGAWQAGMTWFDNHRRDVIQWRRTFDGVFSPFNVRKALLFGVEWRLAWNSPGERLTIGLQHTHVRALNQTGERTTHDRQLPHRPVDVAGLSVQCRMGGCYVTMQQHLASKRWVREAETKAEPGYATTDVLVGGALTLAPGRVEWRAGVQNLWNTDYRIIERAPMPGREWRVSGQVAF